MARLPEPSLLPTDTAGPTKAEFRRATTKLQELLREEEGRRVVSPLRFSEPLVLYEGWRFVRPQGKGFSHPTVSEVSYPMTGPGGLSGVMILDRDYETGRFDFAGYTVGAHGDVDARLGTIASLESTLGAGSKVVFFTALFSGYYGERGSSAVLLIPRSPLAAHADSSTPVPQFDKVYRDDEARAWLRRMAY